MGLLFSNLPFFKLYNIFLCLKDVIRVLQGFNAGLFDYLIATDDSETKEKEQTDAEKKRSKKHKKRKLDSEFGVVRGIDFKNVYTVINFDMPLSAAGYVHRIGRTGRAFNTGQSVSILFLGEDEEKDVTYIAPFPLLEKNAVEFLRYRAEDVARSVTKIVVKEARAQDLRNEILNSDKLKAHFQENPRDLDLLKHDKLLSKKAPAPHLRDVPEYLLDPTTQQASKFVKLTRAAMGRNNNSGRGCKKAGDPLKTFSADVCVALSLKGRRGKAKSLGQNRKRSNKYDASKNQIVASFPNMPTCDNDQTLNCFFINERSTTILENVNQIFSVKSKKSSEFCTIERSLATRHKKTHSQ
ncbi:putative RNA helicase [Helianthus annuus]|nr:putative RNA helicase [Helianthus annuus]